MPHLNPVNALLCMLAFGAFSSACAKRNPSPAPNATGGAQVQGTGGLTTDGSVPDAQLRDVEGDPVDDAGDLAPTDDAATSYMMDSGSKPACTADCGGHGSCLNGACVCETGYQSQLCDQCATGYTRSAHELCIETSDPCSADGFCPNGSDIQILQWGTPFEDVVYAVSVSEDDEVIMAGSTSRDVGPPISSGPLQMVLMGSTDKLASISRNIEWGTTFGDAAYAMALANNGKLYVAGYTWGDLALQNFGGSDITLSTFNAEYSVESTIQWGSPYSERPHRLVVGPAGDIFILGWTWGSFADPTVDNFGIADVFVTKVSPDSKVEWTTQFGSSGNEIAGGLVALDNGDVVVVGSTEGRMTPEATSNGLDIFCTRLNNLGEVTATYQLPAISSDYAYDVARLPDDSLVISGKVDGRILVTKRTTNCEEIWTTILDARVSANAYHVGVDALGAIYIGGETYGHLVPEQHMGHTDAFVAKFDSDGQEIWIRQVGSTEADFVMGMTVMPSGRVYLSGGTGAALPGQEFQGQYDNFVITFEPTTP